MCAQYLADATTFSLSRSVAGERKYNHANNTPPVTRYFAQRSLACFRETRAGKMNAFDFCSLRRF
jgi:hypothetical protein